MEKEGQLIFEVIETGEVVIIYQRMQGGQNIKIFFFKGSQEIIQWYLCLIEGLS
jgi:hypothetical protein